MKKVVLPVFMMLLGYNLSFACPITIETAQNVAENFYRQNSKQVINKTSLTYTKVSSTGKAIYYVFSINQNDGYVIVPADDSQPIMGYALHGTYTSPKVKETASTAVTIDRWSASGWVAGPKKG